MMLRPATSRSRRRSTSLYTPRVPEMMSTRRRSTTRRPPKYRKDSAAQRLTVVKKTISMCAS